MTESFSACKYFLQIELDLLRTLPNNRHYETLSSEGILKLRRVLQAHTQHNPDLGYCQVSKVESFQTHTQHNPDLGYCQVSKVESFQTHTQHNPDLGYCQVSKVESFQTHTQHNPDLWYCQVSKVTNPTYNRDTARIDQMCFSKNRRFIC